MTTPDPIAVTSAGDRLLIRWFAQREVIERLIASKGADDVVFVDTPLVRLELLHDSPADARRALADLAEQAALAGARAKGAA